VLAKAVAALGAESVILDTEVAVFDRQLISRFEWLRGRPEGDVATPPMLMAFDLLELDGEDQRPRPLHERRQALEHLLLTGERLILPVRRLSPNGLTAWQEVIRAGWEGLIAKDPQSPYVGGRTLKWLTVKQRDYRADERGGRGRGSRSRPKPRDVTPFRLGASMSLLDHQPHGPPHQFIDASQFARAADRCSSAIFF